MSIHPPPQLLSLQRYEARILEDAVGTLVACLSGCVWLTQHGDSRDIILHAGDSFRIERPGCVVMAAGRPTRLHLVAPPAEAPRPARARAWWARLFLPRWHAAARHLMQGGGAVPDR